jgi:hypothetical protein
MLTPTKYMDLDLSVIRISSIILKLLKQNRTMGYTEIINYLMGILSDKNQQDIKQIFIPALNFLYLTGKIEYHVTLDSIELLEQQNH